MKIEINLEDIKAFGDTLDPYQDEWCGCVNFMTINCIRDFFVFLGNTEASNELDEYLESIS